MKAQNGTSFWSIMFAIFIGNFIAVLSITTINLAFPVLIDTFDTNLSMVQWLMAGYLLATGIIAPIIGYMGDQISYKRLYIFALIGFALFSLLCAVAWNIHLLIVFRIMQGVCGGMLIPITMTIIYQVIDTSMQAKAMGLWTLASLFAPVFGPTVGGLMIEYFGWQSIFLINIPLCLLAIIIAMKCIPFYLVGTKKAFDSLGFVSVITSSSFLLLAFSKGSEWGWGSWNTLILLVTGGVLLIFFIIWELKTKAPLLQLRVFKNLRFTQSLIVNCIVTVSMYIGTLLIPLYLQMVLNLSALETALIMLPGAIIMAAASPFVGKYYDIIGPFKLILTGIVLIAVSTVALSMIDLHSSIAYITVLQVVRNVGIVLCNMPLTNVAMSAVTREEAGHASSIMNWIRQAMASLSIGIFSSLVVARTAFHLKSGGASNEQWATSLSINDVFWIGSVITVIAIPLAFLLRKKETNQVKQHLVSQAVMED